MYGTACVTAVSDMYMHMCLLCFLLPRCNIPGMYNIMRVNLLQQVGGVVAVVYVHR